MKKIIKKPKTKKLVKAQAGISVKSEPPKTKSFTNPFTGRTRVTEGWKEKPSKGTVAPRPGYAEKKVEVYNKKGENIKTIDKTRELVSAPKNNKFISRGRNVWSYKTNVTKNNKKG